MVVQLDETKQLDYLIKSIEETSKHARTVLFLLVAACSYILLAAFGGVVGETLKLPVLETEVSKELFFALSPILLLALYFYLYLYVRELRQRLDTFASEKVECSMLPDRFMILFPWIGVFSHSRGNDESSQNIQKPAWFVRAAAGLLIWMMGPVAILALLLKFIGEEKAISIIPCLAVIVAGSIGLRHIWTGRMSSILRWFLGPGLIVATMASVPVLRAWLSLETVWSILSEAATRLTSSSEGQIVVTAAVTVLSGFLTAAVGHFVAKKRRAR